jgi:hypothetical protein
VPVAKNHAGSGALTWKASPMRNDSMRGFAGMLSVGLLSVSSACASEPSGPSEADITAQARFACRELRTKLPTRPSGKQIEEFWDSISGEEFVKMNDLCPAETDTMYGLVQHWYRSPDNPDYTPSPADEPTEEFDDGSVEVGYLVLGSASEASITIETPTGSRTENVPVPLINQEDRRGLFFDFLPGEFLYLSAQNQNEFGSVTCRITVDGETISENTASGAFAIAQCEGTS